MPTTRRWCTVDKGVLYYFVSDNDANALKLDIDVFIFPFVVLAAAVIFLIFAELCQSRVRDRLMAMFFGDGLWLCAISPPFRQQHASRVGRSAYLDLTNLRQAFNATARADDESYHRIIACLRRYLVGPDFDAWQTLVATTEELAKERTHQRSEALIQSVTEAAKWLRHRTRERKRDPSSRARQLEQPQAASQLAAISGSVRGIDRSATRLAETGLRSVTSQRLAMGLSDRSAIEEAARRDEAASILGLRWIQRSKWRARSARVEQLLGEQEKMLIRALKGLARDHEIKERNQYQHDNY